MTDEIFWSVIARFDWANEADDDDDAVIAPARAALSRMSTDAIRQFQEILAQKLFALDTLEHARNIGERSFVDEGAYFSQDEFLYARCAAVANGEAFYQRALVDPEEMPKDTEFEAILYLASSAHEEKTGAELEYHPSTNYETFSNWPAWAAVHHLF